jgi:Holliday junction DNA helicase RuvA
MIAKLNGTLAEKSPGEVVVDVGGVGYHAHVSLTTFCRLPDNGRRVELFTVTNLRENALELFAFADRRERAAFTLLRAVSGIGPRMALNILSGIAADELYSVLRAGRVERLVAVPGVGKKTAERMIVELRGRIDGREEAGPELADTEGDAVAALVALGYREADARNAVTASRDSADHGIEGLIKRALARLA